MDSAQGNQYIGLLGGSFNPAHSGHMEISQCALKTIGLDAVWWLVSPQNPMKDACNMAPFQNRFSYAKKLCAETPYENIHVKDIESHTETPYSIDIINKLKNTHSNVKFIWLMGADTFAEFHKWHQYDEILKAIPIVVFSRPGFSIPDLQNFKEYGIKEHYLKNTEISHIKSASLPAWIFIPNTHNTESATKIRNQISENWWENKE